MSYPRARIRTLMIAVALTGVGLALAVICLRGHHFHDSYFRLGPIR